jgi:AraC-like DNA-binding protein
MPGSVMFPALLGVARALGGLGVPASELEKTLGRPLEVTDPDLRVPSELLLRLYERGLEVTGRRDLPVVVARGLTVEHLGVMGFTLVTAPDGPTACQRAVRYARVVFDLGWEWTSHDEGDAIRVSYAAGVPTRLGEQLSCEAAIANWVQCFREVTRVDMRPRSVRFPHPGPGDDKAHRAFFKAPVEFGTGVCDFVFDRADAERAVLPKADSTMNAFFTRYANALLEQHVDTDRSVVERVREYVERHLADGEPTAEAAAKELAMSGRTLRRALQDGGTTFRELVEGVRLARAHALLGQPNVTVSETAYLLGFGDLTAFSRAFKRWTGKSPREYRVQHPS